jgi:hypothetical protein
VKILLLVAAAPLLQAQSDPRVQRLVDRWMSQRPAIGAEREAPRPVKTLSGVLPPVKPCSVPLIEMQIPSDIDFTMQRLVPLKNSIDNMQGNVPAPSCSASKP